MALTVPLVCHGSKKLMLKMGCHFKIKTDVRGTMQRKRPCTLAWIKKRAVPVLKKHAVKRAAVFGSFARGEAKVRSDVDLLIEYKAKDKSLFDLVDLKAELEEKLDRKVDIVTYSSIYAGIRKQILDEQIIIL
jgi:uncharacterized protein